MPFRSDLRDHLQDQLGDGITVYEAGVPIVKAPCVVINPSDPYMVPTSMGLDARVVYNVQLWLVTNKTSPVDALNDLEDMSYVVGQAVKTNQPAGRWVQLGNFGAVQVGDNQYAGAVLEAIFTGSDQRNQT